MELEKEKLGEDEQNVFHCTVLIKAECIVAFYDTGLHTCDSFQSMQMILGTP